MSYLIYFKESESDQNPKNKFLLSTLYSWFKYIILNTFINTFDFKYLNFEIVKYLIIIEHDIFVLKIFFPSCIFIMI